jgi:non-ribosomal peptide synthetase component F
LKYECPRTKLPFGSGEALPVATARRFFSALPDATLVNTYGSTEVAGDATFLALTAGDLADLPGDEAIVPLGDPLPGVRLEVRPLLPSGEGQGQGEAESEVGELHVGGVCVAAGYQGRPDETRARFSEDMQWYKTGDLVQRDARGRLLFRGRADDQCKVRGVRVEPQDVQARVGTALEGLGPTDLLAVIVMGQAGEQRLVLAVAEQVRPGAMSNE